MTRWRVWLAQRNEEAALIQLEAQSFGARSWGENSLKESFSTPGVAILMAGSDEKPPVGFAIWRDLGGEAELLTLGVATDHLRAGVGQALLEAVMDGARSAKAERLFLEVDDGNEAARGLYTSAGFELAGVRRAYYRDGADALVMQLLL
ncbi:MAG: ribosomal protein S18-alanine N-acetyltransferase [Alphaproteobacteria bacterium]|nr:ribosomal protein S18-alanine N-acetyltransferase [Alphaproteobacteria bacterium]